MKRFLVCALFTMALTAPVFAAPIDLVTWAYTDLRANWSLDGGGTSGTMTVSPGTTSAGTVSRVVPVVNTVNWSVGELPGAGADVSNYAATISVTGIAGSGTPADPYRADGAGTVVLIDKDGTTLTMGIAGVFTQLPSFTFFNGIITAAAFGGTADGNFKASNGTSFSTDFSIYSTSWSGLITQFNFTGAWLGLGNYREVSTNATGTVQCVPVPGALGLGMVGLGLVGWMKRRAS